MESVIWFKTLFFHDGRLLSLIYREDLRIPSIVARRRFGKKALALLKHLAYQMAAMKLNGEGVVFGGSV
jgi:hypothetical protein